MAEAFRISVVMPCYNREREVEGAVGTVLAQTVPVHEIIAVDDGSTDGTAARLERLGGPVRVIRQRNAGPGKARNTGIRAAFGDLIAFLDSDDRWEPTKLEQQLRVFALKPEVQVVFSDWRALDRDGRTLFPSGIDRSDWTTGLSLRRTVAVDLGQDAVILGAGFFPVLAAQNRMATSSVLVRRSRLAEAGGFDERTRIGEDWEMWLRLCRGVTVGAVLRPLVTMHEAVNSLCRTIEQSPHLAYILDRLLHLYPDLPPEVARRLRRNLIQYDRHAGWHLFSQGDLRRAREHFRRAAARSRMTPRDALYVLASFLPAPLIGRLRRARGDSEESASSDADPRSCASEDAHSSMGF